MGRQASNLMGVQVSLPDSLLQSLSLSDWCLALFHELREHADAVSLRGRHVALQRTLKPGLACWCGPLPRLWPWSCNQALVLGPNVTATTMLQRGA